MQLVSNNSNYFQGNLKGFTFPVVIPSIPPQSTIQFQAVVGQVTSYDFTNARPPVILWHNVSSSGSVCSYSGLQSMVLHLVLRD